MIPKAAAVINTGIIFDTAVIYQTERGNVRDMALSTNLWLYQQGYLAPRVGVDCCCSSIEVRK
jgi:hypothetical protein